MISFGDRKSFRSLLDRVPVDGAAKAALSALVEAEDRHYHGVAHLALLWRRHRQFAEAEKLNAPEIETLIASAIAYHDSIYVAGRGDNEERSAEFWMRSSAQGTCPSADRQWVVDTIRATKDHLGHVVSSALDLNGADGDVTGLNARERARMWVLDLDLTPLGEIATKFDADSQLLRREASSQTDDEWQAARRLFLGRALRAPSIYRSPTLHAAFEETARANCARALRSV
jgi:predicted metal-dependent HD superfamily phosphohydrolase